MKIGYLGPPGSHSEEALFTLFESKGLCIPAGELIEFPPILTLTQLLSDLTTGKLNAILVPMENALEGAVTEVMDRLAFEFEMPTIQLELIRNIQHRLIRKKTDGIEGIKTVVSHLQAIAQSRDYLTPILGADLNWVPASSTSKAVEMLENEDDSWAALGTEAAAKANGYKIVLDDASHNPNNQTRFVLLSSITNLVNPHFNNKPLKTSICVSPKANAPGVLLEILQVLQAHKINMTKIQSRPTKRQLGEYMFLIDFEGKAPKAFYDQLNQTAAVVKILGEYPCLGVLT